MAAVRDRQAEEAWAAWNDAPSTIAQGQQMPVELRPVDALLEGAPPAAPEEQLAVAIVETKVLASTYRSIAKQVPGTLSWRAERMSDSLQTGLRRYFKEGEE